MKEISGWLNSLPAGAAGGLFTFAAAALALLGGIITLWEHRRRERVNRKEMMRKESYFEMAGIVQMELTALAQMASPNMKDEDVFKPFFDFAPAVGKFQLVADMDGVRILNDLQARILRIRGAIVPMRERMMELKARHDAVMRAMETVLGRIKDAWRPETHGNNPQIAAYSTAMRQFEERLGHYGREIEIVALSIAEQVANMHSEMFEVQIRSILGARTLLGFSIDESAYRNEMKQRLDEVNEVPAANVKERRAILRPQPAEPK